MGNSATMTTASFRRKPGRGDSDAIARRQAVVDIVGTQVVGSQADLADLLVQRGFRVTQATLSRDLKALGIGKIPARGGYMYILPQTAPQPAIEDEVPTVSLDAFIQGIKVVNNLVLLSTPAGQAHAVSRTVDMLGWTEIEGTISGDDTVMVVTKGGDSAQLVSDRLANLTQRRTA
jgi:transcriptional regulator of arginine metabolism